MLFNPDPSKEATEVYFSRKLNQDSPLPLDFNDNTVQTVEVHKHLGLLLDKKLDFNIHIDNKINKCNKITSRMKRLSLTQPAFTCSKLTIETLEQGVKYVQS